MSHFQHYASVRRLLGLSTQPVDLKAALTPERIAHFSAEALGFTLLFGTERIDEEVLAFLLELAKESRALEKMTAMQSGQILNRIEGFPSENRAVLHTAMRDVFTHQQTSKEASSAANGAEEELRKLEKFLSHVEGRFTDVIQIGIGGSDLGPKALCLALEAFYLPGKRVHFI